MIMMQVHAKESKQAIKITEAPVKPTVKSGRTSQGKEPVIFADIYQEEVNIVTWQRELSQTLKDSVRGFIASKPTFQTSLTVTTKNVLLSLQKELGSTHQIELIENIAELVDVFCFLLETKQVGLRLAVLDRAMCPKFHVDRVPCRLITTYQGIATEWLSHESVDRTKLGHGSNGLPDNESGLYQHDDDIQQLRCGDVALLKGETWYNNEGTGLVHRSPALPDSERRLVLTLDVVD